MLPVKSVSMMLCRITAISSLFVGIPVWACSDLPNICEQQFQVHQQNIENARIASEIDYEQQQQQQQLLENVDATSAPQLPIPDPMQTKMNVAMDILTMVTANTAQISQISKDPKFQAYQHGTWEFFQDKTNAKPGEYCAAFFWKKDGMVRVSGPGGDYQGALLTFWSKDIPRPSQVEKVRVTLKQNNEQPQTVEAFNYITPGYEYGAIALAVPTIDAALAGIEDVIHFDLAMNGKSVINVEWHSGLAARDKLKQCVNARSKG